MTSISEFLKSLDLSEYEPNFARGGVKNLGTLRLLSETDLKELEIPVGARRAIQEALTSKSPKPSKEKPKGKTETRHCRHCEGSHKFCSCYEGCARPADIECVDVPSCPKNVWFLVDGGSSMAPHWDSVKAGITSLRAKMRDSDFGAILTFGAERKLWGRGLTGSFDLSKFGEFQPSGKRKMYDAVGLTCRNVVEEHMKKIPGTVISFLYVITTADPNDDQSAITAKQCQEIMELTVKTPGIRIVFVPPKLPPARELVSLAQAGDIDVTAIALENLTRHPTPFAMTRVDQLREYSAVCGDGIGAIIDLLMRREDAAPSSSSDGIKLRIELKVKEQVARTIEVSGIEVKTHTAQHIKSKIADLTNYPVAAMKLGYEGQLVDDSRPLWDQGVRDSTVRLTCVVKL